jgi:hypothetical protein
LEDIRLKSRHKTIITAKIVDSELKGEVVIEPALIISEKTGVMIARVLVDEPKNREVPIQLTNLTKLLLYIRIRQKVSSITYPKKASRLIKYTKMLRKSWLTT